MKPMRRWKLEPGMKMGASVKVTAKSGSKKRGQEYHRRIYRRLHDALAAEAHVDLLVEPWFRCLSVAMMRSPDAIIHLPNVRCAVVVEVKLNWKDGRDVKLIDEYLPIVTNALQLDYAWPLLITSNLRGYQHPPLLGLKKWEDAMMWQPGEPTPVMLVP